MRGICVLVLLLTPIYGLFAQNKPEKQKGLLWEISGNGIAKTGYLYGTMHVSEKLVFNLSDSFFLALQHADVVALETNHDEWQSFTNGLMGMGREALDYAGSYGTRNEYQNLYFGSFLFAPPSREMLAGLLSAKPSMTNEFLYRSNEYQQDYEEDTYLDLFIFQAGKKLGKNVIGLETLEGSYEAVMRARLPDPDATKERRNYNPSGDLSLEVAYREQDLALIDSINRMTSPGKNFQHWMLDERNTLMTHGIDSILQKGSSIFAAVGAAHLPGETGVIQQLRKLGYQLRPVQFTDRKGTTDKDAIDKLRYPVALARNFLTDSSWSAATPGQFYRTINQDGMQQYLCADMSNGAFYAVNRLNTNGWWQGQSEQYISERIDSLIYEHIPGKIYARNRITSPFLGHEISSRTRRGDVLRFKIMVTPQEVVVFSAGGNGNYAQGPEVDSFLNSITLETKQEQKTLLEPTHGGFKINFPRPLSYNSTEQENPTKFLAVSEIGKDSSVYFLYRTNYHDFKYIEEDTFELNIIGESIAEQFTKQAPTMQLVADAPYPTQDISFTAQDGSTHFFLRLVIDGPLYYLLGCRKKDDVKPTAFFNSFEIQDFKYSEKFSETIDTVYHYKVTTLPKKVPKSKAFLDRLRKLYEESAQKMKEKSYEEEYYYADKTEQYSVLASPYMDELISLRVFNAPQGLMSPSIDSLKSSMLQNLSDQHNLLIKSVQWEDQKGVLVGNLMLADTNSTRGIRVKLFVINRKSYRLMATVNQNRLESGFIRSVFNSFQPTDSLDGTSLFGQRNLRFLQTIYSVDSLERASGLDALSEEWRLEFKPEDFPALKRALVHSGFDKLRFRDRRVLINALGSFDSQEALNFALQFYKTHSDSLRYQASILRALAHMQTKNSMEALLDLMLEQPIFLSEEMDQIFAEMSDTLKLASTFVPKLLKLAELDAFRDKVYNLLESMVTSGLIRSKSYRPLMPTLLRESSWDISRYQFMEESRRERASDNYGVYEDISAVDIMRNLRLLAPGLKKNPAIKSLTERLLKIADPVTKVKVYGLYLQQDIPVDRALLEPFYVNPKTHFPLFQQLKYSNKFNSYPGWFTDTISLIKSYIVAQKEVGYSSVNSIDSIRFLSRHPFKVFKRPVFLYFFEVKEKDSKNWILTQLTVEQSLKFFSKQEKKKNDDLFLTMGRYYWDQPQIRTLTNVQEKDKAEYIRKKLGEMRFANRMRYRSTQEDNYYYPND